MARLPWLAWACIGLSVMFCIREAAFASVPGIDTVHFRTYATGQGLSQATARVMVQDRAGFIWIGTQDGLNRFDGYDFRVYKTDRDDPWSLSQNHVWALAADADGSLWVGTQAGGLNHYDPKLDRFSVYRSKPGDAHAVGSNNVTALLLDRDGRLWVANSAGRLQWFDRAEQNFDDTPVGLNAGLRMVRSLLQGPDGRVWIGARDGLWRIESDGTDLREFPIDGRSADVYALAQGGNGDIWIGTAEQGLYRVSGEGEVLQHFRRDDDPFSNGLHDNEIRALLADRDGKLWVAGNSRGLARLDPASTQFSRYGHDPARDSSIAGNRLASLLRGRDGELFVGSWANGFSVQNPRTEVFTRVGSVAGDPRTLPTRLAMTVLGEPDGTLWVGTLEGGGLVHLDPQKGVIARYTHDPAQSDSLSNDFVQFITRTRDGSLWIATMGGGLNRLRPGTSSFEHFRHDPDDPTSLAEDSILYLYEDHVGTLWVGTLNQGLDERCATCSGFRHHAHNPADDDDATSIGGDAVSSIVETSGADIWLGHRSGGLDRYNRETGRFEHFRSDRLNPRTIGGDTVSTLAVDSRGELWLGTQGGGISHLLPGTEGDPQFETFGSKEGLAADAVGAIVEDAQGNLWISTTVGISRFDRKQRSFLNLGPHDGTLGTGYWVNGSSRLPGGRIVFSGLDGISIFDPLQVRMPPPPRPLATRLLLQNLPVKLRWRDPDSPLDKSLWLGGTVSLRHDHDNVTFEFAAFDFTDPESIQYSYRLDGHDEQWIEASASRRFATYTDLPAGSYGLRLRARHQGSVGPGNAWTGEEFVVPVRVAPSPWLSPMAFGGYFAAVALMVWLGGLQVRSSLEQRARAQEAIRISEERLKMSLWGSGNELWDMDLQTGRMHRDNKLQHLAATVEAVEETVEAYLPFVHKDDLPAFNEALAAHFRGDTAQFEASYRTLDRKHEWVWILTRGRIVERDAKGHGLRMAGTTHDISALKHAEDALRRLNEELELRVDRRTSDLRATNLELQETLDRLTLTQRQLLEAEKLASLGGLVAGIAHEINTPLGVSVTAASHLVEEASHLSRMNERGELKRSDLDRFERAAREGSELILRNLKRADRLVRSFKQVAVDQTNEDRRVVDLAACINEILTTLGPALRKTPHKVEIVCAAPVVCETAPGALYQIISNLVMNSLMHAFADGQAGLIRIEVSRAGESAVVDYRDDGSGMDEAARARIFDPFFTTRRGQGGSGLGMHIVYNLVTQVLGGSIVVDSAPGKGFQACMIFELERTGAAGSVGQASG
ncbi:sensor histidine kinase [Dokdonella immobilis]|uniref:histidine kinase n=1 Tax=Dokdonella immobilis TaxID=578942 RepID=A0A1I4Z7T4_9GAMM|nr:sensor histidine kinase [Dokdonella immobilis]SFN46352.1 Two component regulator propeller [Dokdonella immobilis]